MEDEIRGTETHPKEAVPFQQQFSNIPASSSQAEGYPAGAMTHVYPTGTTYPPGNAPIHSSVMSAPGRDFNQTGVGFQVPPDHRPVYHPEHPTWQGGTGPDPGPPVTVGLLPPSSGVAPEGEMRPEFHPNLESMPPQHPHEGNLPA